MVLDRVDVASEVRNRFCTMANMEFMSSVQEKGLRGKKQLKASRRGLEALKKLAQKLFLLRIYLFLNIPY